MYSVFIPAGLEPDGGTCSLHCETFAWTAKAITHQQQLKMLGGFVPPIVFKLQSVRTTPLAMCGNYSCVDGVVVGNSMMQLAHHEEIFEPKNPGDICCWGCRYNFGLSELWTRLGRESQFLKRSPESSPTAPASYLFNRPGIACKAIYWVLRGVSSCQSKVGYPRDHVTACWSDSLFFCFVLWWLLLLSCREGHSMTRCHDHEYLMIFNVCGIPG